MGPCGRRTACQRTWTILHDGEDSFLLCGRFCLSHTPWCEADQSNAGIHVATRCLLVLARPSKSVYAAILSLALHMTQ